MIQYRSKNIENRLDLIPIKKTSYEKLNDFLDTINEMVGCEVQVSELVTSNDLKIYVGQSSRFTDHYSSTYLQKFLSKCWQLATRLSMQDLGFEIVEEQSKRLLEQGVLPFCHAFLFIISSDPQGVLVVVLDRPLVVTENTQLKVITIHSMLQEQEGTLPSVELDHLNPIEESCEALVEEVRELGTHFWVCQYLGDFARFQSAGIPIIHAHEIKVLVSSGNSEPDYLRALVWFALGVESTRNRVNLSFGTFLVIRSGQNETLFAIAKLD